MELYCLFGGVHTAAKRKATTRCGVTDRCAAQQSCTSSRPRLSAASCFQADTQPSTQPPSHSHSMPLTCVARPLLQPEKSSAEAAAAAARQHRVATSTALRIMAAAVGFLDVLLRGWEAWRAWRLEERGSDWRESRCKKGWRWCENGGCLPAEGRGGADVRQES